MPINTIHTPSGYESLRVDQPEAQRPDPTTSKTTRPLDEDRVSISPEGRLKASVLAQAQDGDGVRTDKVASVKARLSEGKYAINGQDVAANLLKKELDVWG